ncbi:GNAT family N-acetyltransferase [Agrobacterium vaccinii]|uniref:GNAT family N-acetyltransferase n=1 Tax=Agrobacterium vaccinii TaxID=2735528 RepID=UPI001E35A2F3|nr:GNAT family N-acetyltransferase [Agrobacterium vaccinii]UHS59999.1 GNAT family N-acetyltransferase [Agrobacterium vaccinii]
MKEHYSPIEIRAWLMGRHPQGYWQGALAGEDYWIADYEGAPIGFASKRQDELLSLFVAPAWQRSGVGSLLLGYKDRLAEIWHLKATLNAVGFYQRFGFQNITTAYQEKRSVRIPYIQMQRI